MLEHGSRLKSFKNNARDLDVSFDPPPPSICFLKFIVFKDLRRRRTETSIELRKQKKEDQVLKRRNISVTDEVAEAANEEINGVALNNGSACNAAVGGVSSTTGVQPQPLSLAEIINIINTTRDPESLFPAVQSIRKMLSRERNPPIDDVIQANLVRELVSFLSCSEHSQLQFEAAWALTNIASGTSQQTRCVVEAGAIGPFIQLLSSPNTNVCEQAVWALGNIAGDGAELRDLVIKFGIIPPLLKLIQHDTPNTFLRNITWTLSNLCRNKNPSPSMEVLHQILPALARLLYISDKEVLTDTCWALSYITDGPNEKIDAVIKTGVVPRLIELLSLHHKTEVGILSPALRCIGNIVTGSDDQTQCVINSNCLPIFHALLQHPKIGVQKEAAWTLSNITAGTKTQIQSVIDAELMPVLVKVLATGEFRVQKEAAWAITNFTSGASSEQILYLVQCNVIKPLCDLLVSNDTKLIKVLLDGLFNILLVRIFKLFKMRITTHFIFYDRLPKRSVSLNKLVSTLKRSTV